MPKKPFISNWIEQFEREAGWKQRFPTITYAGKPQKAPSQVFPEYVNWQHEAAELTWKTADPKLVFPETYGAIPSGLNEALGDLDEQYYIERSRLSSTVVKQQNRPLFSPFLKRIQSLSPKSKRFLYAGMGITTIGALYSISGKDDDWNTIEGMKHGGLAQYHRKMLTDFGSGYDKMRAMAKMLGMSFEEMTSSSAFRQALQQGKLVKSFTPGAFGKAHLMESTFQGKSFRYVRKELHDFDQVVENIYRNTKAVHHDVSRETAVDFTKRHYGFEMEAKALRALGETPTAPSLYGHSESELFMEAMPGVSLGELKASGSWKNRFLTKKAKQEFAETIDVAAQHRLLNRDMHYGNILYDEATGRFSNIDWGATVLERSYGSAYVSGEMRDELARRLHIGPSELLPESRKRKGFFTRAKEVALGFIEKDKTLPKSSRNQVVSEAFAATGAEIPSAKRMAGMQEGGTAATKRAVKTPFGSPTSLVKQFSWMSRVMSKIFGKSNLPSEVRQFMGIALDSNAPKLLDPRKAAKMAQNKSLEEFAQAMGINHYVVRSPKGKLVFEAMQERAYGSANPMAHQAFGGLSAKGQVSVAVNPSGLRQQMYNLAMEKGIDPRLSREVIESEDFLKTVMYHEALEGQAALRFGREGVKDFPHRAGQVLVGEAGFIEQIGNQKLKQFMSAIRDDVEQPFLELGFEGFSEQGNAAIKRKIFSDFGSGYRGLTFSTSKKIAKELTQSNRARACLVSSSFDLKKTQRDLWYNATQGGKKHNKPTGSHVRQLTKHGGDLY